VATHPEDQPLSVQIYGGVADHLVRAAKWLEDEGYSAVDINMGCPMAKITGQGGGARLMCDTDGACGLIGEVVAAVELPVTVKMRLGGAAIKSRRPPWPEEFEQLGVAAITIHGRTALRVFAAMSISMEFAPSSEAVERIPVVGNGDVRTPVDACGCALIPDAPRWPSAEAHSSTPGFFIVCRLLRRAGGGHRFERIGPPG